MTDDDAARSEQVIDMSLLTVILLDYITRFPGISTAALRGIVPLAVTSIHLRRMQAARMIMPLDHPYPGHYRPPGRPRQRWVATSIGHERHALLAGSTVSPPRFPHPSWMGHLVDWMAVGAASIGLLADPCFAALSWNVTIGNLMCPFAIRFDVPHATYDASPRPVSWLALRPWSETPQAWQLRGSPKVSHLLLTWGIDRHHHATSVIASTLERLFASIEPSRISRFHSISVCFVLPSLSSFPPESDIAHLGQLCARYSMRLVVVADETPSWNPARAMVAGSQQHDCSSVLPCIVGSDRVWSKWIHAARDQLCRFPSMW